MPVQGHLMKHAWGAGNVLPRDPENGLEDPTITQWCYWDCQIIKGPDDKYHIFASRWEQSRGHSGWGGSQTVHAVSDNPMGPYKDRGLTGPITRAANATTSRHWCFRTSVTPWW
jgi:hypothetical protein